MIHCAGGKGRHNEPHAKLLTKVAKRHIKSWIVKVGIPGANPGAQCKIHQEDNL